MVAACNGEHLLICSIKVSLFSQVNILRKIELKRVALNLFEKQRRAVFPYLFRLSFQMESLIIHGELSADLKKNLISLLAI